MTFIYLDNNATTFLDPKVAEWMSEVMRSRPGNPASQHQVGRAARAILEQARESILARIGGQVQGMSADQLIFTSGGTESNNLALRGLIGDGSLVVSAIEHPSVLDAAKAMAQEGFSVRILPVRADGVICLDTLREWIERHRAAIQTGAEGKISLVSVMLANNETGVMQPVQDVVRICQGEGILVHTDAVQAIGKIEVDFRELGVDAMTITPHKFHGPVGIGGLLLKNQIQIKPQLTGGFQQLGLRPGTEAVSLAAGFQKAIELADEHRAEASKRMQLLRERLEAELIERSTVPVEVIGKESNRLPHTISLAFPGLDRQQLQMSLDRSEIACSTGSACASGSGQPSHVLKAMGLSEKVVQSAIRISLSRETTLQEVEEAASRILQSVERLSRLGGLAGAR